MNKKIIWGIVIVVVMVIMGRGIIYISSTRLGQEKVSESKFSDWKVYTADNYSIEYPSTLQVIELPPYPSYPNVTSVSFSTGETAIFGITTFRNSSIDDQKARINQLLEGKKKNILIKNQKIDMGTLTISGLSAEKIEETETFIDPNARIQHQTYIFLQSGTTDYQITGQKVFDNDFATGPDFSHFYNSFKVTK